MCSFVGYKYEGGGYRVWDSKRQVVGSRDIIFFDTLPSPTLNDLPPPPADEGESVTQPVLDHTIRLAMQPMHLRSPHCPRRRDAHGHTRGHAGAYIAASTPSAHTLHLPGRGMNSQTAPTAYTQDEPRTPTRTRMRMMDPTRMPTHLRVLSTTFHAYLITLRSRRPRASFAMEGWK